MILNDILNGLKEYKILGDKNIVIENLSHNSKSAKSGTMFFCISGTKTDGILYAKEAIDNGAVAIVCEKPYDANITQVIVKNTRQAMAIISANFFGNPQNKLKIIGITGTNGKTSSTYILGQMLNGIRKRVGIIGTNGIFINGKKFECEMTTPDSIELFEIFAKMVSHKIEYCIMEVSAHAIFFDKIYGINFSVKALTNVSFDHLDFFKTKQNYSKTKAKFFYNGDNFVFNGDDKFSKIIAKNIKKHAKNSKNIIIFGKNQKNLVFFDVKTNLNKTEFNIKFKSKIYHISSNLIGSFNVQNLCLSICVLILLNFKIQDIIKSIAYVKSLPGRFDIIKNKFNIPIIIDYAHTFESLKIFLGEIKKLSSNKNIIVFGAPGERDTTKRQPMGEIAGKFCEYTIITTDNPASENPRRIAYEIMCGVKKTESNCFFEENRKKAIKNAIDLAKKHKNCNVLIVGKGIETCQVIGKYHKKYSDYEAVFCALKTIH